MRNTNCVLYVSNWCVLSKWLCVHGKYIWNKMLTLMNRMTIFEAYQHSIHMTFFITFYFYILIQLESLHNMNISTKYTCQFDVIFVLWFFLHSCLENSYSKQWLYMKGSTIRMLALTLCQQICFLNVSSSKHRTNNYNFCLENWMNYMLT